MKKIISMFLIFAMSITLFVCPVSAETQSYQNEYLEAEKYIANIDFNYFYNSTNIGDDVKKDLKRIQEFISAKEKYTIEDLNTVIEPANTNINNSSRAGYDYSKLLPTSKDVLNANEKVVFNSNPAYGLSVLLQASYANSQEAGRFGSNTWATNGDAFRHALWNALGAHFTSQSYMERFATAHETGSSDYNANSIDTQMDLKNNASGRSLVKSMVLPSNPPNGMVIPYLISNNIATATKNGKLVRFVVNGVQYSTLRATNSATTN